MRQIEPTSMQGRSETEKQACNERASESEKQNTPANRNVIQPRQALRHKPQQKSFRAEENRQTRYSAEQRKKQAFGQQLRYQPLSRGSESLANGHFATSGTGASKQEIGNVDAADQQDQSHRPQQQNQRLANIA